MSAPLARTLDAVQSQRNEAWRTVALRIERAQAEQNRAFCQAAPQGRLLEIAGGLACFLGAGHPLSQALAMGLDGALKAEDVDRIETLLRLDGGIPQFELCPLADPGLFELLACRGYKVQEFQCCWTRALEDDPVALQLPDGIRVRPVSDGRRFLQVVMAGFLECDPEEVPEDLLQSMHPTTEAAGSQLWGAYAGDDLVGGGTLYLHEGTAVLSGAGVPPKHRRMGIQGALIRARLAHAQSQGCTLATSGTAPGSPSQRNMERHGFHIAYPKIVLLAPAVSR